MIVSLRTPRTGVQSNQRSGAVRGAAVRGPTSPRRLFATVRLRPVFGRRSVTDRARASVGPGTFAVAGARGVAQLPRRNRRRVALILSAARAACGRRRARRAIGGITGHVRPIVVLPSSARHTLLPADRRTRASNEWVRPRFAVGAGERQCRRARDRLDRWPVSVLIAIALPAFVGSVLGDALQCRFQRAPGPGCRATGRPSAGRFGDRAASREVVCVRPVAGRVSLAL